MKWMNLPTGEIIVGPVETEMNGKLVCDLAVGGIGPLKKPIEVEVVDGRVVNVSSADSEALRIVEKAQAIDKMAKQVGEFALGLNPKARIVEEFLESEKVGNTIHVAFGNNLDYPGTTANNSANHQDFLIDKPTVKVRYSDGRELVLMDKGEIKV
jgi:leucyl aminopeptidase (aminopeptidase T)